MALDTIRERTTRVYTATIQDENGAAIPGASLTSLFWKLYDRASGDIINGRNGSVNIKSMVDAQGKLTLELKPDDNVILNDALDYEHHVILFTFEYGDDNRGDHEAQLIVKNTSKVP